MSIDTPTPALLVDPATDITLDQLAVELNALAKIRQSARLAFCKRLAIAYMIIVGHRPNRRSKDGHKFRAWVDTNLHAANGKKYSHRTIELYLIIGFDQAPEKMIAARTRHANQQAQQVRRFGAALIRAAAETEPRKPISITALKKQNVPTDVAREVNSLMTLWEQTSPIARQQFLHLVSGQTLHKIGGGYR